MDNYGTTSKRWEDVPIYQQAWVVLLALIVLPFIGFFLVLGPVYKKRSDETARRLAGGEKFFMSIIVFSIWWLTIIKDL